MDILASFDAIRLEQFLNEKILTKIYLKKQIIDILKITLNEQFCFKNF